MDLTEKAMLVRLTIRQWTGRKLDRKVTRAVADAHGTTEDAGRYNKRLLAKERLAKIATIANAARTFHYAQTLPWNDDGARILPAASFATYSAELRAYAAAFESAVDAFVADYPAAMAEAEWQLNGLYNADDYPDAATMRGRFGMETTVDPMPNADDFRVQLTAEDADAIRRRIKARVQTTIHDAMKDLWERLRSAVEHARKRLANEKAIFRDSLIENLRELCEVLPRLNITEDPALNAIAEEVRAKLATQHPQTLRDCSSARKQAHDDADAILKRMSAYTGATP